MTKFLLAFCFCLLTVNAEAKQAKASWYQSGTRTANGQLFNPDGFSIAHRSLPFGTMVKLTNPKTGKSIIAVVNDRGPYIKGREIDVSRGGAIALGFFHSGTAKLLIEVLNKQKVKVKNGYH
jgi:rare lipoprotein A